MKTLKHENQKKYAEDDLLKEIVMHFIVYKAVRLLVLTSALKATRLRLR